MDALPEDLDLITIRRRIATRIIGNVLMRYERVASTNDIARERARSGAAEGLIVLRKNNRQGAGAWDATGWHLTAMRC